MDPATIAALHRARAAEKEQALFYRGLAGQAEAAGDSAAAERLSALHADEQHHLSRLSARLLEIGEALADLRALSAPAATLEIWEDSARRRERAEIERYERLLSMPLDTATRAIVEDSLRVERLHEKTLTGKWTSA